jgi:hypothetical protein
MPLTSSQQIDADRLKLEAALADPTITDKRHIYKQLQELPTTTTAGSGASDVATGIDGSLDIEAIKSLINDVKTELINTTAIADLLIQDSSTTPRYFIRQDKIDQSTGLPTVAIVNIDGSTPLPAPVLPLSPVKAGSSNLINEDLYTAEVAGTGYAIGDSIANVRLLNGETGLIVVSSWYNITTRSAISSAPPIAHLKGYEDKIEELLTAILGIETSNNTALAELGNNSDVSIPATNLDPATIKGLTRLLINKIGSLITISTNKTQFARLTDGVRDAVIKDPSTVAAATDPALVVALSPNSAIVNLPAAVIADIAAIKTNTTKISQFSYQAAEDAAGVALLIKTDTSTSSSTYINTTTGAIVTPVGPIELTDPTSNGGQIELNEYTALTTAAGNWTPNQILTRIRIGNTATNVFTSTIWQKPDGTVLATIPIIDVDCEDTSKTLQTTATNTLSAIGNSADVGIPATVNDPASLKGLLRFLAGKLQTGSQGFANAITIALARKTNIVGFTTTSPAANSNLLDATGAGAATDVSAYNSGVLTIIVPFTLSPVNANFNSAIDAAFTIGLTPVVALKADGTTASSTGSITAAGIYKYRLDLSGIDYFKASLTSGLTGISAYLSLSQLPVGLVENKVNLNLTGQSIAINTPVSLTSNGLATFNSGTIAAGQSWISSFTSGSSCQIEIDVTAISGVGTQSIVTVLQAINSNYQLIYTFEPITTTNGARIYRSPYLPISGANLRVIETVTGASPSITRSIVRNISHQQVNCATITKRSGSFNLLNTGFDIPLYGRTRRIVATNTTATLFYLQIHDSAIALVNGAVPVAAEVYQLPANATVPFTVADLGEHGTVFGVNPRLALSTTFATYTAPATLAANTVSLSVESL